MFRAATSNVSLSLAAIDNFLQNLLNMYEVINCSIYIWIYYSGRATLMVILSRL